MGSDRSDSRKAIASAWGEAHPYQMGAAVGALQSLPLVVWYAIMPSGWIVGLALVGSLFSFVVFSTVIKRVGLTRETQAMRPGRSTDDPGPP